jgi:hypothetical protein
VTDRAAFVHAATLVLGRGGDEGAPGAAVTVALCGSWEHEPPCPLAPHHTAAERTGDEVRLRTVFVVEPALEGLVRERIRTALATGGLAGPDGRRTTWRLRSSRTADLTDPERDLAGRLARGPGAAG